MIEEIVTYVFNMFLLSSIIWVWINFEPIQDQIYKWHYENSESVKKHLIYKLLSCSQCMGLHLGVILFFPVGFNKMEIITWITDAAFLSMLSEYMNRRI